MTYSKPSIAPILPVCSAEKIDLLTDMLNVSVDCIKVINTNGCLIFMNRSGCEALGVSVEEKEFGMAWLKLLPDSVHRKGRIALKKAVNGECSGFRGISVLSDGSVTHWDNMLTPVLDNAGKTTSILCISRNITLQVQAEEKLKVSSETDPLTGLPNRRMFKKHLKSTLAKAKRRTENVGVLFIDLDNFKGINDTLGHAAGDRALIQFTADLKKISPDHAFISRLGGDEFAVVMDSADPNVLTSYANYILSEVRRKIRFSRSEADFGLTIGAAVYPVHGGTADELMKCADTAMYQQKSNGKNGFMMF
ncbi:GGDEF domain-containing protein [Erwiniaceae bacterium BAC15a-03b]|uniref:GGDEF domain-containing protein n=1 Tax=Winslowiella arboricola TaxID=2978220 RepID=A0A9J6Q2F6_9GAMM|nr:GGDEF domain-containing protein [Winslowiella arboricola]MCU5775107.1 GGDEF domain-containing protein [Winslowiella arboricola]MCU5780439.1 GGDEF domain-containing protein [Winslowiella arboricola]